MSASDWISVTGLVIATFGGIAGWILRQLYEMIKALTKEIGELQKSLPGTYMRRDDMQKFKDDLSAEIRDLAFRLDHHVDESVARWVNSERNPLPPGTPHGG